MWMHSISRTELCAFSVLSLFPCFCCTLSICIASACNGIVNLMASPSYTDSTCLDVIMDTWQLHTIGVPDWKWSSFQLRSSRVGGGVSYSYSWPMRVHHPSHSPRFYRSSSGRCCKWRRKESWVTKFVKSDAWKHFGCPRKVSVAW